MQPIGFDHDQHGLHAAREQDRIGKTKDRRTVDDHRVIFFRELAERLLHTWAGQKREGGGEHLASRHDVETIFAVLLNGLRGSCCAAQHFGETRPFVRAEKFPQRWVAQVPVDQQSRPAHCGDAAGDPDRRGRLAFGRAGAGDKQCLRQDSAGSLLESYHDRMICFGLGRPPAGQPEVGMGLAGLQGDDS